MSSSEGKLMKLEVLAMDGQLLGHVHRKATNPSWRILGQTPQVKLRRDRTASVVIREDGTRYVTLLKGEVPPADMASVLGTLPSEATR